ncbi:MAG: BON domain-containing protein [Planctomycetota bacterium]
MQTVTQTAIKSDARIKADVLSELAWDPRVHDNNVTLAVRSGTVTITGQAASLAAHVAIVDAAHRVQGVLDVVDEMTVAPSATAIRNDDEIAHAVREALRWDAYLPDDRIQMTVSSGVVTLQGVVNNWSNRSDAEKVVKRIVGVRGIVNRLTVGGTTIDPVAIKLQIERALERRAEREARRIVVTVRDGAVTLTGPVASWAERQMVERVAGSSPGVRSVTDRMTIEPYL